MSIESAFQLDQRTHAALAELEGIIRRRYPAVSFAVARGEDPDGIYLRATVDLEDVDEVVDQELLDRLFDIQVEQGLPVYVIPARPLKRVLEDLQRPRARRRPRIDWGAVVPRA